MCWAISRDAARPRHRRFPGRPLPRGRPGRLPVARDPVVREHDGQPDRRADERRQQEVREPEPVPGDALRRALPGEDERLLLFLLPLLGQRALAQNVGHAASWVRSISGSFRPTQLSSSIELVAVQLLAARRACPRSVSIASLFWRTRL